MARVSAPNRRLVQYCMHDCLLLQLPVNITLSSTNGGFDYVELILKQKLEMYGKRFLAGIFLPFIQKSRHRHGTPQQKNSK
jgi:hypothetical protein